MENEIVERLYAWRKDHRLSQTAVGKKLNLDQKTISRWETGRKEPTPAQVEMIEVLINGSGTLETPTALGFAVVDQSVRYIPLQANTWKFADCLKYLINNKTRSHFWKVGVNMEVVTLDHFLEQLKQQDLTAWIMVQEQTILKVFETYDHMIHFMVESKKDLVYDLGWSDRLTVVPTTPEFVDRVIQSEGGQVEYKITEYKEIKIII